MVARAIAFTIKRTAYSTPSFGGESRIAFIIKQTHFCDFSQNFVYLTFIFPYVFVLSINGTLWSLISVIRVQVRVSMDKLLRQVYGPSRLGRGLESTNN